MLENFKDHITKINNCINLVTYVIYIDNQQLIISSTTMCLWIHYCYVMNLRYSLAFMRNHRIITNVSVTTPKLLGVRVYKN